MYFYTLLVRSTFDGYRRMQNIYDNQEFYEGYERLRANGAGLNEVLEQPALRSLLPSIQGASVIDIGCGFGDFCRFASASGASRILGVDPSEKMLGVARDQAKPREQYIIGSFESLSVNERFDLAVSSLALHYVKDMRKAFQNVARVLKPGGFFAFSLEHPIATCGQGGNGGWLKDGSGRKVAWKVDSYSNEGLRQSHWFVDGVIKYHRTVSTIINELVDAGFRIDRVLEPHASPEAEVKRPELLEERRRPPFLLILAGLQAVEQADVVDA